VANKIYMHLAFAPRRLGYAGFLTRYEYEFPPYDSILVKDKSSILALL
jgi:hypothetical protein